QNASKKKYMGIATSQHHAEGQVLHRHAIIGSEHQLGFLRNAQEALSVLRGDAALAGELGEYRAGGDRSVEGFYPACHWDGHDNVAVFVDHTRDALAFRTDHNNNWVFAALVGIEDVLSDGI